MSGLHSRRKRFWLRPPLEQDLDGCARLMADEESSRFFGGPCRVLPPGVKAAGATAQPVPAGSKEREAQVAAQHIGRFTKKYTHSRNVR